jgi:hypothetical protein
MNTFDNRGRLLGDTDVQAQLDADVAAGPGAPGAVGTPGNPMQLPAMTVTGPAAVSFSWAQLLQPPYVYMVIAALGIAAWLYKDKSR